ncbi:hypothetical protein SAVIM338S_00042 [Streptomyces avidinii]
MGGAGAVLAAAALAGCAAVAWQVYLGPALAEPHTYRAETAPGWVRGSGIGDAGDRLKQFGASYVSGSESDEGSYLDVRFPGQEPGWRGASVKALVRRSSPNCSPSVSRASVMPSV